MNAIRDITYQVLFPALVAKIEKSLRNIQNLNIYIETLLPVLSSNGSYPLTLLNYEKNYEISSYRGPK